ncbi:MAG: class I SAM-dependent methyltransferase [bacterium]|nr:class I SAM-dependent methyltransferase [bacterium]
MNELYWKSKKTLYERFRHRAPFQKILERENENLLRLLKQTHHCDKAVVDLGVGIGNVIQFLPDAKTLIGIDYSDSMIKSTREHFPHCKLILADVMHIPLSSNSVDLITAVGLTEYLKDIIPLAKEVCRVLKPGGFLIITFSPKNILTRLRVLLGRPVYSRKPEQMISVAKFCGFEIVDELQSLMQHQALFAKTTD